LGVFRWNPGMAAFAATGVILSATYMLWMFQRVNYGTVTNEKNARLSDLQPREWAVIVPIIALAVLMGVAPNLFLRPIEPSVARMLNHYYRSAPARIQADTLPSSRDHHPLALGHPASALLSRDRATARLAEPQARRPQP
jgi:NADH:ubiquinone oxidoreductase subunit 4 (subunit M)